MAGGWNIDGTSYDFQAPIRDSGALHPRFDGVKKVGGLIRSHEEALLSSRAVESKVGLCASARALGWGYGYDGEQRIYGDELRGCYGWLAAGGFSPRLLDVELAADEEL